MRHMYIGILATMVLVAAVLVVGTAPSADDPVTGPATVSTDSQAPHGTYVVDGKGMSLYLFESDQQGSGESTCSGTCAEAWPPFLTDGSPEVEGEAQASLLGTIEREDGSQQVTYNGWPLYYFIKDEQPGDAKGHDVKGFGAEWYLIASNGEQVAHKEEEE